MKKLILIIMFTLGLMPFINKGKLKFCCINSVYAQEWGSEEDSDGNIYFPVNAGPLPTDGDIASMQTGDRACGFAGIEIVMNYYGMSSMSQSQLADVYIRNVSFRRQ